MRALLVALLSVVLASTALANKDDGVPFGINVASLQSVLDKSETSLFVGVEYGRLVESFEGSSLRSSVDLDHSLKQVSLGATTTFFSNHQVAYYASYYRSDIDGIRVNGVEMSLAGNGLSSRLSGAGVGVGYEFVFDALPEVSVGVGPSVERFQVKEVFCAADATASLGSCSTSRHSVVFTSLQASAMVYQHVTPYIKVVRTSRVGKNPSIPDGKGLGFVLGVKGSINIF